MRIHPRTLVVQKAQADFGFALCELIERHHLTGGELLMILASALEQQARFTIKDERYPNDPQKGGDEE